MPRSSDRAQRRWRDVAVLLVAAMSAGCFGNRSGSGASPPPPVANVLAVTIDGGPAGAPGQFNHPYVSVKVCPRGSQSGCATLDHVLLATGSVGLRLVRSAMQAASLTLSASMDAQGQPIEECASFGGGDTWGPIAVADITLAGEQAANVPIQILDDVSSGAPPPSTCGANGTLINDVASLGANGVLGLGVFIQDCGAACVAPAAPLPMYYGCSSAGACAAENVALAAQVGNVAAAFGADNNGVLVACTQPGECERRCNRTGRVDIRHRNAVGQYSASHGTDGACRRRQWASSPRLTMAWRCRR